MDNHLLEEEEANELIDRDINENNKFGQHTQDTFHLSDFYIDYGTNSEKLEKDIWRILDLIFGKPFLTPTPDEFAMFMAFSASLRSADLSRQVGAVVARGEDIISTGANDVPKFGGGLYWPSIKYSEKYEISDAPEGRDYMRGEDSNHAQKQEIIEEILSVIEDEEDVGARESTKFRYAQGESITFPEVVARLEGVDQEAVLAAGVAVADRVRSHRVR